MASDTPQSFATHRKFVPMYHFVTSLLILVTFGHAIRNLVVDFSVGHIIELATAFALISMLLFLRLFPLGVQDRVIRLEEQLRMARLLPADLQDRIAEFTPGQMVGLRFASDAELPDLARRVLDGGITDREEIKKLITTWRPDLARI